MERTAEGLNWMTKCREWLTRLEWRRLWGIGGQGRSRRAAQAADSSPETGEYQPKGSIIEDNHITKGLNNYIHVLWMSPWLWRHEWSGFLVCWLNVPTMLFLSNKIRSKQHNSQTVLALRIERVSLATPDCPAPYIKTQQPWVGWLLLCQPFRKLQSKTIMVTFFR